MRHINQSPNFVPHLTRVPNSAKTHGELALTLSELGNAKAAKVEAAQALEFDDLMRIEHPDKKLELELRAALERLAN